MAQEQAFFDALESVASFRASEERLEFADSAGKVLLVYTPKLPPAVDPALKDTEWLLSSLYGRGPMADSRITLNLGAQGFNGFAGCNDYGGEYEAADKGTLLTSDILRTEMLCQSPEGIMEQESSYFGALSSSATYRLTDGLLEIEDGSGETVLAFTRREEFPTDPRALVGTAWRLASVDGESPGEGSNVTLDLFSDSVLGGHLGCRDYLEVYEATGDNLTPLSTAMFDAGCGTATVASRLESKVSGVLMDQADLQLAEGQLTIWGEKGGVMVFEPLPDEADLDLEGTTWSLLAFVGPNPYVEEPDPRPFPLGLLEGTAIDLMLEGGAARGSAGCNSYGAAYSRDGSSLRFEAITATEMACLDPEGIMKQEVHYLELLAAVTAADVYGDHLWLDAGDGQALVFYALGR
jgi:heat shock protein HslJ